MEENPGTDVSGGLPVETHPGSAGSRDRCIYAFDSAYSLVDRDKTDPSLMVRPPNPAR